MEESPPVSGVPRAAGPTVLIRAELCKACGLCITFCPRGVLRQGRYINELGYAATEYAGEGCIGCGTCFYVCPEPGAIAVYRPERSGKSTPLPTEVAQS